jgi:hypothetical protein
MGVICNAQKGINKCINILACRPTSVTSCHVPAGVKSGLIGKIESIKLSGVRITLCSYIVILKDGKKTGTPAGRNECHRRKNSSQNGG